MEPKVREATLDDGDRLGELWGEADALHHAALPHVFAAPADPARSAQDVTGILDDPGQGLLVAQDGTRLVGLVHVTLRERYPPMVAKRFAVVEAVVVAAEDRGTGVGRVLMAAAERWARDRGAEEVWLDVWEFNDAAVGFYEALGYETVSQTHAPGTRGLSRGHHRNERPPLGPITSDRSYAVFQHAGPFWAPASLFFRLTA